MSQYTAPGRDGTYVNDPGRENPTYNEQESLLMLNELDNKEDEDNPYRAPDDDSDDDSYYRDDSGKGRNDDSDDDSDDLFFEEDKQAMDRRDDSSDAEDPSEFRDEGEDDEEDEEGRRQWKYSTANIKQNGVWMKWCCILLFFILCFMIFAAISLLFNRLFFNDPEQEGDHEYTKRADNETFPSNKEFIDLVCSTGTYEQDQGVRCREFCEPMYSSCCDPFPQYGTYNFTTIHEALNVTQPPTFVLDDDDFMHLNECEYGDHLRGCAAYSKCAAMRGLLDPAPHSLPILCSDEGDRESCEAACRKVQCCFNEDGLSCLTENMDVCMDYAPCQNLRERDNEEQKLPVAPDDLDRLCLWKLPQCAEVCERARCCTDTNSRCFQENFVACLTYAACEDDTDINITVPEMYNYLPHAPGELLYACGEKDAESQEIIDLVQPQSCPEYCEQVACCYQAHPQDNCFHKDPLGCLAWHQHCQSERVAVDNWYIGDFILPTPP